MYGRDGEDGAGIYAEVAGGPELVRHFGRVPSFRGANVENLHLNRGGASVLVVHHRADAADAGVDGASPGERQAVVTFVLTCVVRLRLDGFGVETVVDGLVLRRAVDRIEQGGLVEEVPAPGYVEIAMAARHGPECLIRARSVAIEFEPGGPRPTVHDTGGDDWLPSRVDRVLCGIWDPLSRGAGGSGYGRHVPGLVDLTRDDAVSEDALVAHLARIEVVEMGLSLPSAKRVRAARALLGLRDARAEGTGRLIEQWSSPDGLQVLRIVATRHGRYAYERRALLHEGDGDGRRSWWEDVGTGRSGLFETFAAAEREARHLVEWVRGEAASS